MQQVVHLATALAEQGYVIGRRRSLNARGFDQTLGREVLGGHEVVIGTTERARRQCRKARPVAETIEQSPIFAEHGTARFGLAKARELAQRGLAAKSLDQQKYLMGILSVAHQVAHGAERSNRMQAVAGGLRHGFCPRLDSTR